jgi:hypothetical protein
MHTQSQEVERQTEVKRGDLKAQLIAFLLEDPKLNLSADLAELEAEAFVELAKSRTGILVEHGDGIYSFVHLTFQEYFAACDLEKRYITDLERLWREIQPHLYDPRWREVILLLLGRLNEHDEPPSIIVEKILRERDKFDEVLHRNLFLAAACLADRVNVKEPLRASITGQLIKLSGTQYPRYPSLQRDAIITLGTLQGDKAVGDALLKLIWDKRVYGLVRRIAAYVFGEWGREEAIRLLLEMTREQKLPVDVRVVVAEALKDLGFIEEAKGALLTLANDKRIEESERYSVMQAFTSFSNEYNTSNHELQDPEQDQKIDLGALSAPSQDWDRHGQTESMGIQGLLALAQNKIVNQFELDATIQAFGKLGFTDAAMQIATSQVQDLKRKSFIRLDAIYGLGLLGQGNHNVAMTLLELAQEKEMQINDMVYYSEMDNGQKRIKRTGRKTAGRKQKAVGRKQKTKSKNRKSKI